MFEKFTDNAIKVMSTAREEARKRNHNFIGTEHILLGLFIENSKSAQILNLFQVNLEKILNELRDFSDKDAFAQSGPILFTQSAKELLEMASAEARKREQPITELHLLLAITCTKGSHLDIFQNLNIDVDNVKKCATEEVNNLELKLKNYSFYFSFGYILFIIVLLFFSYVLLNDLILSLRLTFNNFIAMIGIVIISFLIRNNLIFRFGVGQLPFKLTQLIRVICFIIGILFISVLVLTIIISVAVFLGKHKYSL